MMWLFNIRPLRKALISRPFLKTYLRMLPTMSATEREALEAGTVWWDGELFTGKPDWNKLLDTRPAQLTAEEQAFIDGPVRNSSARWSMTSTSRIAAPICSPEAWDFIKRERFWAMIIPKQYGGLELGRYAQSSALTKLSSRSIALATTVDGAELAGPRRAAGALRHRGTEGLLPAAPRARRGDPLLRLTSPVAGSDAALDHRHRHRVPRHAMKAARSSASGSTSPSATSRSRRSRRSSASPSACSIPSTCSAPPRTSASPAR